MATPWPEIKADRVTVGTTLTFPNRITVNNLPTDTPNRVLITSAGGLPFFATGTTGQTFAVTGTNVGFVNRSWGYSVNYYTFGVQDWNAAATNLLTFANTLGASGTTGTVVYTAPSFVSSSVIRANTARTYRITMQASLNNPDVTPVSVKLNVLVNGIVRGAGPSLTVAPGDTASVIGYVITNLAVNDTVSIQSTRVSGTTALNSNATDSTFSIEMMQYSS